MFVRWRWTMIAVAAALGFACTGAWAQADIEAKAQTCAACHGANGVPSDPKTIPNIWGQQQYYLFKQLVDYRLGLREHPIMTPLAKSLNHADLRPLAAYFAAKPWPAQPAAALPGTQPNGMAICLPCHQQKFEGGVSWPRLAGMDYDYLVAAMRAFASEQRNNNDDMVRIMQMFSDSQRDAMARYIAGL